jgi:heterotetrameric sarcosine oxidase delta subunit
MLRIPCPVCGPRDETEFTYGGDATVRRPADDTTDMDAWVAYVFERPNPRGKHREYWHHVSGCRQWLVVERDTLTHDISACHLARGET